MTIFPKSRLFPQPVKGYNLTYIACSSSGVRWSGFSDTTDKRFPALS
jgi:hypothetical protein